LEGEVYARLNGSPGSWSHPAQATAADGCTDSGSTEHTVFPLFAENQQE